MPVPAVAKLQLVFVAAVVTAEAGLAPTTPSTTRGKQRSVEARATVTQHHRNSELLSRLVDFDGGQHDLEMPTDQVSALNGLVCTPRVTELA